MDAIEVEGLRKSHGEVQALAVVGFAVRAGEVFGLLGPKGAGRSTTVRVLAKRSIRIGTLSARIGCETGAES